MTVEPGLRRPDVHEGRRRRRSSSPRASTCRHKPVGAEVHVDGGVNRETAEFVGGLGVDILVVGSVLWIKGRDMGREIRLVRALADEGYQYRLNNGKPPIPRDAMVTFAQLPKHLAWKFMAEIEKGGIPVIPLRGTGQFNPDGVRDYDLLVPATVEALTVERHAADRDRYLAEADAGARRTSPSTGQATETCDRCRRTRRWLARLRAAESRGRSSSGRPAPGCASATTSSARSAPGWSCCSASGRTTTRRSRTRWPVASRSSGSSTTRTAGRTCP